MTLWNIVPSGFGKEHHDDPSHDESEAAEAYEILDLCLGDRAPFGLLDFLTSTPSRRRAERPPARMPPDSF
jgi:hypothetical protein